MTTNKPVATTGLLKWDGAVNLGAMIQVVVFVGTAFLAWGAFDKRITLIEIKQDEMKAQVDKIALRTERMELYLVSHDPKYLEEMPK